MALSTKLSVAVHVLVLLDINKEKTPTSDCIAASVNTNPVVIRKIMSLLKKAKIIHSAPGTGPTYLLKDPKEISLLDIYLAVEETTAVFHTHKNPNQNCPIGKNIQGVLEMEYAKVQTIMENELKNLYLDRIILEMKQTI